MKRTAFFWALVFHFAGISACAQVPAGFIDGLQIDMIGDQYFQSGNLVATDVLKINLQLRYPQCAPFVSKSNSYRTKGIIAKGAGAFFTIGGLSTSITGASLEDPIASMYLYTASALNFLVATVCYLVAIPMDRNRRSSLSDSVRIYNQLLLESGKSSTPAAEKPSEPAAQTIVSAPAAAETAIQAGPSLIATVPTRTITIDGDYSDWEGLPPAFVDAKGDSKREFPGLDIKEIYLAKDLKNLFVHFVLFDEGFPTYPAINMSAEVQLELGHEEFLNLAIRYNNPQMKGGDYSAHQGWSSQLQLYNDNYKTLATLARGFLKRSGTGCEASFPIAAFYKRVQMGKEYRTKGQIWKSSGGEQLDNTGESRLLIF